MNGPNTEMGAASRLAYRLLRLLLLAVCKIWFRVQIVGSENIPATGGFILAPGAHRSILDTPISALAGSRILRYMGAENYFNKAGLGTFLRAMGGFPVERSMTDRAALRIAQEVLERGEPLVVFPEGTRQQGPSITNMKEGASFLAARAGVPIVPVGIGGAARALPKGRRIARPHKMAVVVGRPILPSGRASGSGQETGPETVSADGSAAQSGNGPGGGRVRRSEVKAMTEELKATLQVLYDEAESLAGVERDELEAPSSSELSEPPSV